ncbi:hypothetical protein ACFQQB_69750 [Nonomuraea rubra]|uniref:hypothetical protein n=1 Tax=Nonomuraea rubra TaxID=46180 RepID=UPI003613A820
MSRRSRWAGVRAAARTRAPQWRAYRSAARPRPVASSCRSRVSSGDSLAWTVRARWACRFGSGAVAASASGVPAGVVVRRRAGVRTWEAGVPGASPVTRSPGLRPVTPSPTAVTRPAQDHQGRGAPVLRTGRVAARTSTATRPGPGGGGGAVRVQAGSGASRSGARSRA